MDSGGATAITWYGHACIEIGTPGGATVLVDPWFANPASPRSPDTVDTCDVMLVTHGHADHLGNAIPIASRSRPKWPAIHEMTLWLSSVYSAPDDVIGMNKGGTVEVAGLRITMTSADHSAGDWDNDTGMPRYLGEPAGFVIELEDGSRIYHAGDTNVFGDMRLIGEMHAPEIAFLPIGDHFTMDPEQGASACRFLNVQRVIPIHWGTFPLLRGTPADLARALMDLGSSTVVVALRPGESWTPED